MQVTRTMLMPLFSTVIAVVLDAVILGDRLRWRTLAGGAAVMAGLAFALSGRRPPAGSNQTPMARP